MGYLALQCFDSTTTSVAARRKGTDRLLEDTIYVYSGPDSELVWSLTPAEAETLSLQLQAALSQLEQPRPVEHPSNLEQLRIRD